MRHTEIISQCGQKRCFPGEFEKQSFVQVIFPHEKSDWIDYLEEARKNFVNIVNAIAKYERCLVVCDDIELVKSYFSENENIEYVQFETNDTWARDCSAISIIENGEKKLLDFTFTGWGSKFDASKDNEMSRALAAHYKTPMKTIDFILEGGAIESNSKGLLLTTSICVLNKNRNASYSKEETTQLLKEELGVNEILYLDYGYLAGDDTDSHIDTLARFVDEKTIMYLKCDDQDDEHYEQLFKMQEQLKELAKQYDLDLIALPFTDAIYYDDERLPATYANFLIINGAVIVPTYGVRQDEEALSVFRDFFKDRDVVAVDCSVLIRQHGSLHCVTMQFL
ncbi:agmatine deiminase family protein [Sulfurimonas sp. HSL3-2]|uniref:agmatine deiminase family protein n=1 Tax=Hydrocurvibacter mobilis TaxID=3131936 RepID=UPI0031F9ADD9